MWCIPEITPEYAKRMFDILDLYHEKYNPKKPVIGFDEKSKQLIEDARQPIPMKPGSSEKYDYEYIRNGTANIFVAVEPKAGRRITEVTTQRTKSETVLFLKRLVDEDYADAQIVRLVLDNLNTHFEKSFYEILGITEAKRILKRIEFHYTPKHASWLNVAEIEINVLSSQCVGGRIKNKELLKKEVEAWTRTRNLAKKKIDWTFTTKAAKKKLAKYLPNN